MDVIYIPNLLKVKDKTKEIHFEEFIPGLDTLTPIRGKLRVRHGGNFLEVAVVAETIMTLTCDRCLKQYNHRLTLNTSELIWLDKNASTPQSYPQEREISWDDLSESLSPDGEFDLQNWLYEQLSLNLPLRRLCSNNCEQPVTSASQAESNVDSRWAALESLKQQLSQ
ncbi:protein of unknown function DUF177 [Gloeothece citriformis PCC 7424]|uniref:Metal-binding protein n=1 Tax=Gloeothece citriformis (strain PCC 7424) TaxID=65393 RepID=B7KIL3_GLOC7|nr:YceD family protein [Gloeothece citriformis]ACK69419.1 protein of unknown function DUF177 [Gloeothece citriformis PCC 7424]